MQTKFTFYKSLITLSKQDSICDHLKLKNYITVILHNYNVLSLITLTNFSFTTFGLSTVFTNLLYMGRQLNRFKSKTGVESFEQN